MCTLTIFGEKMKKIVSLLIDKSIEMINSVEFLEQSRLSKKHFIRERKMGFKKIVLFCLNLIKKSLQLELDDFVELLDEDIEKPISKQAFSKARQHISPNGFKALFTMTAKETLESREMQCFKGYRVFAIDGTELELTRSAELSEAFPPTKQATLPKARVSILCDVLNSYIIHADIKSLAIGERRLAQEHVEFYLNNKPKNLNGLLIFDRGYPSKALVEELSKAKVKFLMRLQKSFSAEIDNSTKEDFYVNFNNNGTVTKVRVIKLTLSTGEQETLITNLGHSKFKKNEFEKLYFLRWGVETKYNCIKNKLQIEEFSGKTVISVLQDFYATMYLSNMAAAFKCESDSRIAQSDLGKELKHQYKTNESIVIGKLKNNLILILLCNDPLKRELLMEKLLQRLQSNKVASVPNRHFERPKEAHKKTRSRVKRVV